MSRSKLHNAPGAIVRLALVRVRRAGPVLWLVCRGCGRAGDVARDAEDLSVAGIDHRGWCPVARALWADMIACGLDHNGRWPRRQARAA